MVLKAPSLVKIETNTTSNQIGVFFIHRNKVILTSFVDNIQKYVPKISALWLPMEELFSMINDTKVQALAAFWLTPNEIEVSGCCDNDHDSSIEEHRGILADTENSNAAAMELFLTTFFKYHVKRS